jgi:hypothetical protein
MGPGCNSIPENGCDRYDTKGFLHNSKERPILFSGEMVRQILAGKQTQTRRVVFKNSCIIPPLNAYRCVYGKPGDRLWVRETWATSVGCDTKKPSTLETPGNGYGWPVWFLADNSVWWRGAKAGGPSFTTRGKWRPSIHMPRWASRITLEVVNVRAERLKDISEEDARAEGVEKKRCQYDLDEPCRHCKPYCPANTIAQFKELWDSINGKKPGRAWADNPWVWVVEFKVAEAGK